MFEGARKQNFNLTFVVLGVSIAVSVQTVNGDGGGRKAKLRSRAREIPVSSQAMESAYLASVKSVVVRELPRMRS